MPPLRAADGRTRRFRALPERLAHIPSLRVGEALRLIPAEAPAVSPEPTTGDGGLFLRSLDRYRDVVMTEMRRVIAAKRFQRALAQRLADYPLRSGKGLRPALCLATCQAFGGRAEDALPSATSLEFFHNAFLVHDDVEDESINRRGAPTMHSKHGVAIAVNVGDALNVLSMTPLLDNLEVVGLEKSLRIFREIERMACESVEGQALELEWVRNRHWNLTDRHYHVMTCKKTCWYTCITPLRVGAIIGARHDVDLEVFVRFGTLMGIAFQIQDDLLNLLGEEGKYGKETAGDIWEGKRTLMLIHLLQHATVRERRRVVRVMSKSREEKAGGEVEEVLALMRRHGSLDHGRRVAREFANRAKGLFGRSMGDLPASPHKQFLHEMIEYVINRDL